MAGDAVDRPPVSFWGHVYDRESSAPDLADSTLEHRERYDWDLSSSTRAPPTTASRGASPSAIPAGPTSKPERLDSRCARSTTSCAWRPATRRRPRSASSSRPSAWSERACRRRPAGRDRVLPLGRRRRPVGNTAGRPRAHAAHREALCSRLEAVTSTFAASFAPSGRRRRRHLLRHRRVGDRRPPWTPEEYRRWARPYDRRCSSRAQAQRSTCSTSAGATSCSCARRLSRARVLVGRHRARQPRSPRRPGRQRGGDRGHGPRRCSPGRTPEAVLRQLEHGFALTGGRRWIVAPGCSIHPALPRNCAHP